MSTTLEDIRVGDIMLCSDGVERKVASSLSTFVRMEDGVGVRLANLRNPEFRAGDKVRWRTGNGPVFRLLDAEAKELNGSSSKWIALVERAPVAGKEKPMSTTLEDIRVGDIMLYGGHEVRLTERDRHGYWTVVSDAGTWFLISSDILSNPEFRVGDKVRFRGAREGIHVCDGTGTPHLWALVERAPVEEKKLEKRAGPWVRLGNGDWCRDHAMRVALVVQEDFGHMAIADGVEKMCCGLDHAKAWCDARLRASGWVLVERAPVSDTVKQERKAGFIIEAWKQWPEHKDDGSCTAAGCGVCAIDKAEDTVPDNKVETCLCCPSPPRPGEPTCANCYEPVRKTQEMFKGKFVKHDESKPRMDLLPPLALKAMARVLTLGSYKYSDHNWRNIPREERSRLVASLLRHVTAAMAGEDLDPESGASHWAHAMANAAFLCELFELDKIAEDKFRR